jgi:hypothetical protein
VWVCESVGVPRVCVCVCRTCLWIQHRGMTGFGHGQGKAKALQWVALGMHAHVGTRHG